MIIFLIFVLAIFSIASTLYQVKKLQPIFQKYDPIGLLPNYSFFAPKPISFDYRIVFREISDQEWIEVPIYKNFNFFRFLWSPFKYYNKGFIDSCQFLLQEYESLENKKFIKLSLNYLIFLTIISRVINDNKEKKIIRFAIINSKRNENIFLDKVIFASYNQII